MDNTPLHEYSYVEEKLPEHVWHRFVNGLLLGEINYTSHVADNIYKLPRLGVSGLAKEMGVPPEIVTDGVHTHFSQVSETRSTELCEIVKQHKRSQEAENEDEDSSTLEKQIYLLENHLMKALEFIKFISLTPNLSLDEILSTCDLNRELQILYIRLYIQFRKFCGYEDGDKPQETLIHIDEKVDPYQDNMDHVLFSELCTKTKTWLREKNAPLPVREAFHQVRSKTKRICAGPELDASIPEWFAMSLRKWAAKNGCPKCRYLAPRLIHEGRCHEESTEVNNYLREAIDPNDDKTYLAPYHAGSFL
ncbi:hypothetical protein Tco_0153007 [Tanacetum coccineum]